MTSRFHRLFLLGLLAMVSACGPRAKEPAKTANTVVEAGALLSVGTIVVNQSDLDQQLKENHGGRVDEASRSEALAELASRAQLAQAALDAGLLNDAVVRAEFARILAGRFKEKELFPRLKALAAQEIPESRLRELYTAEAGRFRSNEMRQAAVLWLDPNKNPERAKQYVDKLTTAREWFSQNADLRNHPEQGFSTLGVDYSEHQASRYKNGVVGWLESGGGMDAWTKAVAEILFSLPEPGAVSEVISRPEGVFLVRYIATRPAVLREFESVSAELTRSEQQRLRHDAESRFSKSIEDKYPVRRLE